MVERASYLLEKLIAGANLDRVIDEAVDSFDHAHALLKHYGYLIDPRHKPEPQYRWYTHKDGHQAFLRFDAANGYIWNHYQVNPRQQIRQGETFNFKKGAGTDTLDMFLQGVHGRS